jgi:NAD(P)-dependent dehydrogenase (short-subunit alcohol dehydrogenase family)
MKAIVISASSDIGFALCEDWKNKGWDIIGTYRTQSKLVQLLKNDLDVHVIKCNYTSEKSINQACKKILKKFDYWDVLVFAVGDLKPVGMFVDVDFHEWQNAVNINFMKSMQVLHTLLSKRSSLRGITSSVIFFAGGGTNNPVPFYSSYMISKIALIKMCEQLACEIPDTRFLIIGPGWVKTKIHEATVQAGSKNCGENYDKTLQKLQSQECTKMKDVIDCCNWLIDAPLNDVSGRNFSVVYDKWGEDSLLNELKNDSNKFKLRRYKN